MRVVSLLPAATEMVDVLGALASLVGVTHECDHPAAARSCPRMTGTAIDVTADAATVDAQVRRVAAAGMPLFTLDAAALRTARPDVILTQALCDVCAVSEEDVRHVAAGCDPIPRLVTLNATTLDGVLSDLARVGDALGRPEAAARWRETAVARMHRVHETLKAARAPRPRVAVIEWGDPLYAAGHWTPELVRRAGGIDVLATPGAHSVPVTLDTIQHANPELILIAPCGYDLPRAVAEAQRLRAHPDWAWARDRRWAALDANALLSRPGPRLIDGLEAIAHTVAPTLLPSPPTDHLVLLP
ncbi:MAG: ABC transporter substrate-binding protein [Gemmatimonadota bacterium]